MQVIDIMQVIAEMLIDIPVENFHFEHFKLRTEEGDRMFSFSKIYYESTFPICMYQGFVLLVP